MTEKNVRRIPIVSLDDSRYSRLARLVVFPPSAKPGVMEFFPAIAGFNIGSGVDVDLSFLYSFNMEPSGGVDRHIRTEEMFVPLDGDLCLPLAPCEEAYGGAIPPRIENFVGVRICHGEALILSKNVWHNGGWPVDAKSGVRYIMVLSGHREAHAGGGPIDFVTATLPGQGTIIPDW